MMCGGFTCSRNSLTALNIMYILVGFILILVAFYGRESALVTNLPIVSGIMACGVFLILVSILGLFGAVKHNQVMLFFYMIILFLLFIVQFGIACACLGVSLPKQEKLVEEGWRSVSMDMKAKVQRTFSCCGFDNKSHNATDPMAHPECIPDPHCCPVGTDGGCICPPCLGKVQNTIDYAFKLCGGIGLLFCITEFLGVWLTIRYRNQKDPRANPSAFL